jgi:hypothetical protein
LSYYFLTTLEGFHNLFDVLIIFGLWPPTQGLYQPITELREVLTVGQGSAGVEGGEIEAFAFFANSTRVKLHEAFHFNFEVLAA